VCLCRAGGVRGRPAKGNTCLVPSRRQGPL